MNTKLTTTLTPDAVAKLNHLAAQRGMNRATAIVHAISLAAFLNDVATLGGRVEVVYRDGTRRVVENLGG